MFKKISKVTLIDEKTNKLNKSIKSHIVIDNNAKRRWSSEEETQLFKEISVNLTDKQIAMLHGRTANAIRRRREDIAVKMYQTGEIMSDIYKKTKVDEEKINYLIKLLNKNNLENENIRYTEYITIGSQFELILDRQIDLVNQLCKIK